MSVRDPEEALVEFELETCSFGVYAGKFLGITILLRFVSRSAETALPIFHYLRKNERGLPENENNAGIAPILIRPTPGNPLSGLFINLPIKQVLRKPNLAGRMVGWTVQFFEFDISFERISHIKAQALTEFIIELSPVGQKFSSGREWFLFVHRASNQKGNGASVILEGPDSNNQAKYEALLARMKLAGELWAQVLTPKSDSKLITSQVNKDNQARDPYLIKY
ncbi:hypothetical protein CR513_43872, partial [Mucuna pruriens]